MRVSLVLASVTLLLALGSCSLFTSLDGLSGGAADDGGADSADALADGSTTDADADGSNRHCANGGRDRDESDVDCGGSKCPPCADGRACALRSDCASLVCVSAKCSGDVGCSDGTREGYVPVATFPNIAACSGGWSVAGVLSEVTKTPACGRASGNDTPNRAGAGCNVADLCQVGWHVCATSLEVAKKSGGVGCDAVATDDAFFVTRQSGVGAGKCGAGANDLFGCGARGASADAATCSPLAKYSRDLCVALGPPWTCGADNLQEANHVTKPTSDGGGVLCCRD